MNSYNDDNFNDYFVLILVFHGAIENTKEIFSKRLIDGVLANFDYITLPHSKVCFVIKLPMISVEKKSFMLPIQKEINNISACLGLSVTTIAGPSVKNIANLSFSFKQAMEIFSSQQYYLDSYKTNWSEDILAEASSYFFFPDSYQKKLQTAMYEGNYSTCYTLLDELFNENFAFRHLSFSIQNLFFNELSCNIFRSCQNIPDYANAMEGFYQQLQQIQDSHKYMLKACEIIEEICTKRKVNLNLSDVQFAEHLKKVIEDHYFDCNFSLTVAAEQFKYTESYFSQLFKKLVGVNFSAYLEKIRLDKAHQLLTTGTTIVDEVAAACGYSSVYSFRRAYKRIFGTTPSNTRGKRSLSAHSEESDH